MTEAIVSAVIGGVFGLVTAIVTIRLQQNKKLRKAQRELIRHKQSMNQYWWEDLA